MKLTKRDLGDGVSVEMPLENGMLCGYISLTVITETNGLARIVLGPKSAKNLMLFFRDVIDEMNAEKARK